MESGGNSAGRFNRHTQFDEPVLNLTFRLAPKVDRLVRSPAGGNAEHLESRIQNCDANPQKGNRQRNRAGKDYQR